MSKYIHLGLKVVILFSSLASCMGGHSDPSIGWAEGQLVAATVVSLQFDDTYASQAQVRQLLASRGLHGTFFVNSGRIGTPGYLTLSDLQGLAQDGNEIASHTVFHEHLIATFPDEAKREICDDRAALVGLGFPVSSFAYPFGEISAPVVQAVRDCGFNSGRRTGAAPPLSTVGPWPESIPPADPFVTRAPSSFTNTTTLADMQALVINAENHGGGWVQATFHKICTPLCDTYSMTPAQLAAFLDWVVARASTGTVVKTVHEVVGGAVLPARAGPPAPEHVPSRSMLINPSFEAATLISTNADCWRMGTSGSQSGDTSRVSDAQDGAWGQRLNLTSSTSGGTVRIESTSDLGACAPPIYPGQGYRVTGWYKSTSSVIPIAHYRSMALGWASLANGQSLGPASSWTPFTYNIPSAPTGSMSISVGMELLTVGSLTIDNVTLMDVNTVAPVVDISSPTDGSEISGQVTLSANASDDQGIYRVELLVNGTVISTTKTLPPVFTYDTSQLADGPVTLSARALDLAGNTTTASIGVTVNNSTPGVDTTSPTASIQCNGGSCSGYFRQAGVTLAATDSQSGVAQIRYTTDPTNPVDPMGTLGIVYSGPFNVSATTLVRFGAVDNAGNASAPITQAIQIDTVPPANLIVASPVNGASVFGRINVTGSVTDNVGISRVRLFVDGTEVNSTTQAPFSIPWDTGTVGNKTTHLVHVSATDLAGNQVQTTAISITVNQSAKKKH